ncbi:hypothetical protein [Corynebacterium nuruki]|jgi:hypothetical protein|uniref:hypothetical protein n=1 Tax=Corynebacterium nuruki TaxID=1032851 RepID=UPI0002485EB4|nr:hypothetical protein [Corynebacterium nuruki]MDN6438080.1 hypothetical protein [Corynebacterium nuruki]
MTQMTVVPADEPRQPLARETTATVAAASAAAVDCLRRSTVIRRMADGSLPFAGRAAYLEQHWEGLRVLRTALADPACTGAPTAGLRRILAVVTERFATTLDRAHATARWRDRHVTVPSTLEFRRHVAELLAAGDTAALVAHVLLRLDCAAVCLRPATADTTVDAPTDGLRDIAGALVHDEEGLERLSEEFSAALMLVLQHGSDICRGYQDRNPDAECMVTVSMIRGALQQ